MNRFQRFFSRRGIERLLIVVWVIIYGPGGALAEAPRGLDAVADAELTSIAFLDPDRGWAVGDRGTIWQTDDGGRVWKRQESPSTARWESIQFVDSRNGWLVGGVIQAYTQKTTAAVAQTRDGGATWKSISAATLPALKAVRFIDERRGWVAGSATAMYPSGLFRTEDGGRSWTPMTNLPNHGWQTFDLFGGNGLAIGRYGECAFIQTITAKVAPAINAGLRQPRRVKLDRTNHGWLVGDAGLILETSDNGASWNVPHGLPAVEVLRELDFADVAVVGDHCWLAGAPGSCLLHSSDRGKSWQLQHTGQTLPLRALAFLDDRRGWGVGALGTILATRDGGATWSRQHSGGQRAAVLGIFSQADRVPWELFGQVSANDGYLSVLELLNRRDVELTPREEASPEDRARAALTLAGGSSTTLAATFPRRQAKLPLKAEAILELWREEEGRAGIVALEDYLVKKIQQWRPDVIITQDIPRSERDPADSLLQQALLRAYQRASIADKSQTLQAQLGLEPWKAKKAFAVSVGEQTGGISLSTTQLAPRLGKTLADAVAGSRGLVTAQFSLSPTEYNARVLASNIPQEIGRRDLMGGIVLATGGEARRAQDSSLVGDMKELNRAAQQQRLVQQLMTRTVQDASGGSNWLAKIEDLTRGLRKETAGDILFQLAQRYYDAGKIDLAAETMTVLVELHPEHDLAGAALMWLVQLNASSEVAQRLPETAKVSSQVVTAIAPSKEGATPTAKLASSPSSPERTVSQNPGRDVQAISFAKRLERTQPELYARPSVRFPLTTVQRRVGQSREVDQFLRNLASARAHDAWGNCASAEIALSAGKTTTKSVYGCELAKNKPKLDGQLDDDVWQKAKKIELRSLLVDDGEWPATVSLGRDDEFLYISIQCQKAAGASYPGSDTTRPRDPDLRDRDRVELLIDLDRDYTSFFQLTIDHRGWVAESCFGDVSWNPTWFVAAKDTPTHWMAEAAIPLKELTSNPLTNKDVWALGVQRIVPGVGFQAWTQPASVDVRPEGFGWLMFE